MNASFVIPTPKGPRTIGGTAPCFVVAEMSGNHNGSYDKAVEIVKTAAQDIAFATPLSWDLIQA